jgi:hypothetical protein
MLRRIYGCISYCDFSKSRSVICRAKQYKNNQLTPLDADEQDTTIFLDMDSYLSSNTA